MYNLHDLLLYLYEDTLIPELFDLLGEDETIKLVKVFGGMKIDLPAYKKVSDLKRNIEIYECLTRRKDHVIIKRLAEKYGITEVWVREMFRKMQTEFPKIREFVEERKNIEKVFVTSRRIERRGNQEKKKENNNKKESC